MLEVREKRLRSIINRMVRRFWEEIRDTLLRRCGLLANCVSGHAHVTTNQRTYALHTLRYMYIHINIYIVVHTAFMILVNARLVTSLVNDSQSVRPPNIHYNTMPVNCIGRPTLKERIQNLLNYVFSGSKFKISYYSMLLFLRKNSRGNFFEAHRVKGNGQLDALFVTLSRGIPEFRRNLTFRTTFTVIPVQFPSSAFFAM